MSALLQEVGMLCGALVAAVSGRNGGTITCETQRWFQNFETTTSMERPADGPTLSPCHSMHQHTYTLSIPVAESAGKQAEVRDMTENFPLPPRENGERALQAAEGTFSHAGRRVWSGAGLQPFGDRSAPVHRVLGGRASEQQKGENPAVGGESGSGT